MKRGSVSIGMAVMPAPQSHDFYASLLRLNRWDVAEGGHLNPEAPMIVISGGPSLAGKRNKIVRSFLDDTDSEWLLFIDDDETFDPNLVGRMVESADADKRPILSALIMADRGPGMGLRIGPACTLFHEDKFVVPPFIPAEQHWEVATAGTGCLLIHRRVLEQMGEAHADDAFPWFKHGQRNDPDTGEPGEMAEDYVFSLRAAALGFPIVVDTTIELGHIKNRTLTTADFYAQPGVEPAPPRTVAIIPVKDKLHYTKGVVRQLLDDDGCDEIIVVDNGSKQATQKWLAGQDVTTIEMPGAGIHAMWNYATSYALSKARGPVNLLYLNNDLRLGDGFCGGLAEALRNGPPELVAVCPNYDGRDGQGVERLQSISANRYDGTGGLCGFAFMVRSELFTQAGYRFPEDCMWWFGDNDLTLTIDTLLGGWYGMVHGVEVEHLDGGGRTGDWSSDEMQPQLAADKAAFEEKWRAIFAQQAPEQVA